MPNITSKFQNEFHLLQLQKDTDLLSKTNNLNIDEMMTFRKTRKKKESI